MNTGNMTKVIDEVIPIRTFLDGSYAIGCAFCEGSGVFPETEWVTSTSRQSHVQCVKGKVLTSSESVKTFLQNADTVTVAAEVGTPTDSSWGMFAQFAAERA